MTVESALRAGFLQDSGPFNASIHELPRRVIFSETRMQLCDLSNQLLAVKDALYHQCLYILD
jgi:hypothetical protein